MSWARFAFCALVLVLHPAFAFAGQETRNGGHAVVCSDSVEPLDLYEGRVLFGLEIRPKVDNENDYLSSPYALARARLETLRAADPAYYDDALSALNLVDGRFRSVDADTELELIPDAFPVVHPRGCSIEQLAIFQEALGLLVSAPLWDRMGLVGQAALLTHEAIYKVERDRFGATNSLIARQITARLFSQTPVDRNFLAWVRAQYQNASY